MLLMNGAFTGPSRHAVFVLVAVLLPAIASARPKKDVLIMKNGDRITCEIKKLERGQLQIKTSYTLGTIYVNWDRIDRIESSQLFQVELSKGGRFSGAIERQPVKEKPEKNFQIINEDQTVAVGHPEVVDIEQLGANILQQLDGKIDFGLNFTKNNNQGQLNFNGQVQRRSEKNLLGFSESSTLTRQSAGLDTNRHNATVTFYRFLSRNWFVAPGPISSPATSSNWTCAPLSPASSGGDCSVPIARTGRCSGGRFGTTRNSQKTRRPSRERTTPRASSVRATRCSDSIPPK